MFPGVLEDVVRATLADLVASCELPAMPAAVTFERPRDPAHGDWSTNVALTSAKAAGRPPREVAALLVDRLPTIPGVAEVTVAGPGFVNFRLADAAVGDTLRSLLEAGDSVGRSDRHAGERAQVEFVSVNPTGPMHVGHARNAIVGDVIANLLGAVGYAVEREFYVNDGGAQVARYGASLQARYLALLGEDAPMPEEGYVGQYVVDWAAELHAEVGAAWRQNPVADFTRWGVDRAVADMRETLAGIGITFDVWFRESSLDSSGAVAHILDELRAAGHVYDADGATWLRTTTFGDDKDRVAIKANGDYTYFLPDVAYHRDKLARGFDLVVDVLGADHHGDVARVKAGLAGLGLDPGRVEMLLYQVVSLVRSGEELTMGKRAGIIELFSDLYREVGPDATRWFLAAYDVNVRITFDLDLAVRKTMDNPVFYVQYAHARARSIEKKATDLGVARPPLADAALGRLDDPAERGLVADLERFGDVVADAAERRAPHRLCTYLHDLATDFHRWYTAGNEDPAKRVLVPADAELSGARLWLTEGVRRVVASGLGLLGITAPDAM